MYEAIEHFTGIDISEMDESTMAETAKSLGIEINIAMGRGKLIDEIFGENVKVNYTTNLHYRLSSRDVTFS